MCTTSLGRELGAGPSALLFLQPLLSPRDAVLALIAATASGRQRRVRNAWIAPAGLPWTPRTPAHTPAQACWRTSPPRVADSRAASSASKSAAQSGHGRQHHHQLQPPFDVAAFRSCSRRPRPTSHTLMKLSAAGLRAFARNAAQPAWTRRGFRSGAQPAERGMRWWCAAQQRQVRDRPEEGRKGTRDSYRMLGSGDEDSHRASDADGDLPSSWPLPKDEEWRVALRRPEQVKDEMRPALAVVETAFMVATTVVFYVVGKITGYFVPTELLYPFPVLILALRWDDHRALIATLTTSLLMSVVLGPTTAVKYVLETASVSLALGYCLSRRIDWLLTSLAATVVCFAGQGVKVVLVWVFLGIDLYATFVEDGAKLFEELFPGGAASLPLHWDTQTWVQAVTLTAIAVSIFMYVLSIEIIMWQLNISLLRFDISPPPWWLFEDYDERMLHK